MKFTAKKDFKDFKGEIKAGDAIELTELSRINALKRLGLISEYEEKPKKEVNNRYISKGVDLQSSVTVEIEDEDGDN